MIKYFIQSLALYISFQTYYIYSVDVNALQPPPELQKKLDIFFTKNSLYFDPIFTTLHIQSLAASIGRELFKPFKAASLTTDITKNIKTHYTLLNQILNDQNCHIFKNDDRSLIFEIPTIPGYICKLPGYSFGLSNVDNLSNLSRCEGAQKLQDCIETYQLSQHIKIPQKYAYCVNQNYTTKLTPIYAIIVEKIPSVRSFSFYKNISIEQFNALCILVRETAYEDSHEQNFLLTPDNKLAFIDTEEMNQASIETISYAIEDYKTFHNRLSPKYRTLKNLITNNNIALHQIAKNLFQDIKAKRALETLSLCAHNDAMRAILDKNIMNVRIKIQKYINSYINKTLT